MDTENITAQPGVISCCVCLNLKGDRVPASTIANGYAVCDEHIELAGQPGFSIISMVKRRNAV